MKLSNFICRILLLLPLKRLSTILFHVFIRFLKIFIYFYFFLFCFFFRHFSIYFVFGFSLLIVVFISFYYNILHVIFFYTFHVSAIKALYFYHLLPLLFEVLSKVWGNWNDVSEPNIFPATLCTFLYKHQATELLRKWRWKLDFRVNFMILRTLQVHIALQPIYVP